MSEPLADANVSKNKSRSWTLARYRLPSCYFSTSYLLYYTLASLACYRLSLVDLTKKNRLAQYLYTIFRISDHIPISGFFL